MTHWKSIAADAIALGLLIPPEPPKPKAAVVVTVKQLRDRKQPCFEAHKERLRSHICAKAGCGKPAKYSERLGRYIERCEECARKNCEATLRIQHAKK